MCDRFLKLSLCFSLSLGLWGCESLPKSPLSFKSEPAPSPFLSPSFLDSLTLSSPLVSPTPSPIADFVITLTLTSPQDLQVQTGDLITKGQVLSRNNLKYQELLQKQQQLDSQLRQKVIPLTPPQMKIDIRKQEAALKQAQLIVAQSQQKHQQIKESLRFKTMALAEALDAEKVQQMNLLEQQKREAEQKIATLTNEIQTAQEQYISATASHQQAEQIRQQEIKQLLSQIQEVKQQLKRLPIVAPISGNITKIEYKDQTNQTLTAKVVVKPTLESTTSLPIVPLPSLSPVPTLNNLP
ncbi:MAG: hypothetical protein AB4041_13595 [Microcystaceae cyanobacterium]